MCIMHHSFELMAHLQLHLFGHCVTAATCNRWLAANSHPCRDLRPLSAITIWQMSTSAGLILTKKRGFPISSRRAERGARTLHTGRQSDYRSRSAAASLRHDRTRARHAWPTIFGFCLPHKDRLLRAWIFREHPLFRVCFDTGLF